MKIKNNGPVRSLSHEGEDRLLTPGAWVELPLTEDEAEAYRGLGFEVTGEPVKVAKKGKAE